MVGWTHNSNQKVQRLQKHVLFYLWMSSLVTKLTGETPAKIEKWARESDQCLWLVLCVLERDREEQDRGSCGMKETPEPLNRAE